MLRTDIELASGLVRFYSKEQARSYLEAMLEFYSMKSQEYGQQMGGLLRGVAPPAGPTEAKEAKNNGNTKVVAKGWVKVGTLPVNIGDASKALGEVTLKIVEEYKMRSEKTSEVLKSFNNLESINVSDASSYTLFVNRGVPEALIVMESKTKRESFVYAAKFRAV
jgi:hypothetical protein